MERHVQTIIVSLILGAIMFAGNYLFSDRGDKAVLTNQMQMLITQVAELRGEVRAQQTNSATKDQYLDHENRIRALERRVLK